ETAIPESDEDLAEPILEEDEEEPVEDVEKSTEEPGEDLKVLENATSQLQALRAEAVSEEPVASPAQSKFVVDKLETVTQEPLELRLSHENTRSDYELLEAKYEEAVKALAEMQQDKLDEARRPAPSVQNEPSRPVSFFEEATAPASKFGAQHSFSRSL